MSKPRPSFCLFPDPNSDTFTCTHGYNPNSTASGDTEFKRDSVRTVDQIEFLSGPRDCDCDWAEDPDAARYFPYFAALDALESRGYTQPVTQVEFVKFPQSWILTHLKAKVEAQIQSQSRLQVQTEAQGGTLVMIWPELGTDPELSHILNRDCVTAWVGVTSVTGVLAAVRTLPRLDSSVLIPTVKEGPQTQTLCLAGGPNLIGKRSIRADFHVGKLNWYDARLRVSRVSSDLCRDCALVVKHCSSLG